MKPECPMRHENGNCLPAGGFCTAVNAPICEALFNAYDMGQRKMYTMFVEAFAGGQLLSEEQKKFLIDRVVQND